MKKKIPAVLFFIFCQLIFIRPLFAETPVRVLVLENQRMVKLNVRGDYVIRVLPSMQIAKKGKGLANAWFVPTPAGIRIGRQEWACRGMLIETAGERDLVLGQSRFRGTISLLKDKNNFFYAVNTLDIESYLYGVLHHEVASWWPMEALKAQAIAARTYALYQASVSRRFEYDLKSGTASQVYGASTTERYRTKRAVDLTAGKVLMFQGKVFPAYFHATCAGLTAGAGELWNMNLAPLAGGVHCNYCRISPHYNWEARVPLAEIEGKLNKYKRPIGQVLKIEIITQTPSHRVGSLRITGTSGEAVLAAKDFRVWVGGDRMRSTLFTVEIRDDMAYFHGRGWGHGVGLCQWGSLGQAILGRTYDQILELYYPGAQIVNYASKTT